MAPLCGKNTCTRQLENRFAFCLLPIPILILICGTSLKWGFHERVAYIVYRILKSFFLIFSLVFYIVFNTLNYRTKILLWKSTLKQLWNVLQQYPVCGTVSTCSSNNYFEIISSLDIWLAAKSSNLHCMCMCVRACVYDCVRVYLYLRHVADRVRLIAPRRSLAN